jgi:tripartite-type tricarboxylate transporter receptor subunit TctC
MPQRSSTFPNVPTVAQSDPRLREFDLIAWTGIAGPPGLPQPIVTRIYQETEKALKEDSVVQRLQAAGAQPAPSAPDVFAQRMAHELVRTTQLIKTLNLKAQ